MSLHHRFTRLDLVIGLAVPGLVLALFFPAVLNWRESARRSQCGDNLRQIGAALNAYHDVHQTLPPASIQPDKRNRITLWAPEGEPKDILVAPQANWTVLLLPYLGKEDLFIKFDPAVPVFDARNEAARTTELAIMTCPSDSFHNTENNYVMEQEDRTKSVFARGNFAINMGVSAVWKGTDNPGYPQVDPIRVTTEGNMERWWGNGVAGFNKSFSFKNFTNRLSTTVVVDEIRAGILPVDARGAWALGLVGSSITHAHGIYGDCSNPNPPDKNADDSYGAVRLHQCLDADTIVKEGMTCCDHHWQFHQAGARSLHPNGVNVLTADGAVHFTFNDVNRNLWHLIHSRETPREIDVRGISSHASEGTFLTVDKIDAQVNAEGRNSESSLSNAALDKEKEIANSLGMKLRLIPTGEYQMGAPTNEISIAFPEETPEHLVRITKPFYMGVYEVTRQEYQEIMHAYPALHTYDRTTDIKADGESSDLIAAKQHNEHFNQLNDALKAAKERLAAKVARQEISKSQAIKERQTLQERSQRERAKLVTAWNEEDALRKTSLREDLAKEEARVAKEIADLKRHPVNLVSWYDAVEFCKCLSELPEEKAAGRRYRLPTEAEWEYAGRGGDASPEMDDPELQERHNRWPTAVGSGTPNVFGLYDMSENVCEWCSDWFLREYYAVSPTNDPQGPSDGALKVVRGSNWLFRGNQCQYTQSPAEPWRANRFIGFRVVCEIVKP